MASNHPLLRRSARPRTVRRSATALLAALLLALGTAAPLSGQEPADTAGDRAPEPFAGTFMYDADAGDDIEKVVDRGVELVDSWLKRQFARGRIRETNRPYDFIQIFPSADSVTVHTEQWSLTVPRGGEVLEEWERAPDDLVDVTMEWRDGAWVQGFEASDGVRVNRYTLGPDGETLTMEVTLTSDQLSGPLEYELVYRRR